MAKRYETDLSDKDELDMAPMIDMVFLLLIFFMVTAQAYQESQVRIEQPVAVNAKITKEPVDRLPITITEDEKLYMRGSETDKETIASVVKELSDALTRQNRSLKIYLRADARVKHAKVKEMMRTCAEAGVAEIIFSAFQN
jgi:biopolymer transport protein ExbD